MEAKNKFKPSTQNSMEIEDMIEGLEMLKGRLIRAERNHESEGHHSEASLDRLGAQQVTRMIRELQIIDKALLPWEG